MFTSNLGTPDRILRLVIGVALIAWFFFDQGMGLWHYAKIVVGLILAGTAVIDFCPIYALFGLSTKGK